MPQKYEVAVMGGGHNGLAVAAYLAKAGVRVILLEAKSYVGGGVTTREVVEPGFKHDECSTAHMLIQANPMIRKDELGLLSKYGLKYIIPEEDPIYTCLFDDDTYISLYKDVDRTCQSIATVSGRDAETYKEFYQVQEPLVTFLAEGFFAPPPPFGQLLATLDKGPGQELIRALQMSPWDIAQEWFEHPKVRMFLSRLATETAIGIEDKGGGAYLLALVPFIHKFGSGIPQGGSGALSEAIALCLKDRGGTIRTEAEVRRIKVRGEKIAGVVLADGEEIDTERVVADINVKQLPSIIGEENLPSDFLKKVAKARISSFSGMLQSYDLNEPPNYKAGREVNRTLIVQITPSSVEECRKSFDSLKYGERPPNLLAFCVAATVHDATRAPQGKHTLYFWNFEPADLKEGGFEGWDKVKEKEADRLLKLYQERTINMGPENIRGRFVKTPLDISRYNTSFIKGDYMHLEGSLFQFFSYRPFPGYGNYKMPIENLYLCGPSTHPGGGVSGGGRAAAMVIMEDMGLEFEKVIGR